MFNQYAEQFQSYLTPFNQLFANHVKALEKMAQVQTELFTGVMDDGVEYLQGMSSKRNLATVGEVHRQYWQSLQDRMTEALRETYSVFALSGELTSEVVQVAIKKAAESNTEAANLFTHKEMIAPQPAENAVRPH